MKYHSTFILRNKNKMKGRDIFDRDFIILKVGIYDYNVDLKKLDRYFFRYARTELTHPSTFIIGRAL